MTTTPFTDNVTIDGSRDITQLSVEGHSTQNQPLQTWQNSAGSALVQVTGDGRLAVGDDLGVATPDSLVEVHRADTSTSKPKRGFHSLGRIGGALSDVVNWSVHELELLGNGVVSALQTALRVRATYDNAATSSSADIRAADVEASIKQGQINSLTGLRTAITKTSGIVTNAYGVKVEDVSAASNNFALHTGTGIVHHGDKVELTPPASTTGAPPTNGVWLYPKNGKPYAKDSGGTEYDLAGADSLNFNTFAFFGDQFWYSVGTPATLVTPSFPYNWVKYTITDGATALFQCLMDSGTWEINILTAKANNYGKLNVTIDGNAIVSNLDLYASTTNYTYLHTLTGVSLSGDKVRDWVFSVSGKNASSIGYAMLITKVWGRKTGP